MIHFECQHCHRAVRVADTCRGKRGRCPHCHEVVAIPAEGRAIEALAAALTAEAAEAKDDTAVGRIPPPPSVGERPLEDELLLPEETQDDLDDTVILPAEEIEEPEDDLIDRLFHSPTRRPPALNSRRTFLIVAVALVVLAAATIGFLVLYYTRR